MSLTEGRAFACPIPKCVNRKTSDQVLCNQHWLRVPPETRRLVWREFRKERGSVDHMAAIADAIKSVTP